MCSGGPAAPDIPIQSQPDDVLASYGMPQLNASAEAVMDTENGQPLYAYNDAGERVQAYRYTVNGEAVSQQVYDQANADYGSQLGLHNAAQAELQRRQQVREELQRIANERTAEAQRQQAEIQRLQAEQKQAAVEQERQVVALREQEAQQQQQIAASRLATNAAAASLRVLQGGQQAKAPTAAVARAPRTAAQRRGTSTSELRIGSGPAAPGVGLNIGG